MLKKTMTYTDFNGEEIKEDFYFHLSKAEIVEMQLEEKGGLAERVKKIVDTKNVPEIVKVFKDLILKAYGVKSDDGKRFIKSKQLSEEFSQTQAYSDLFMELATDADAAAAFINGIIPAELQQAKNKEIPLKK